jgi:hypothetical protein
VLLHRDSGFMLFFLSVQSSLRGRPPLCQLYVLPFVSSRSLFQRQPMQTLLLLQAGGVTALVHQVCQLKVLRSAVRTIVVLLLCSDSCGVWSNEKVVVKF